MREYSSKDIVLNSTSEALHYIMYQKNPLKP